MHLPHTFLMAPSVVEAFLASRRSDREGLCLRTRSLLVRRRRECPVPTSVLSRGGLRRSDCAYGSAVGLAPHSNVNRRWPLAVDSSALMPLS